MVIEICWPGQMWFFPGHSSRHLGSKMVLQIIGRLVEEARIREFRTGSGKQAGTST